MALDALSTRFTVRIAAVRFYVHDEGDEWDLVYNVERGAEIK
jgi:hypothetical protein